MSQLIPINTTVWVNILKSSDQTLWNLDLFRGIINKIERKELSQYNWKIGQKEGKKIIYLWIRMLKKKLTRLQMASDKQKVEGLASVQNTLALPGSQFFSHYMHCTEVNKSLKNEAWITAHHICTNFGNAYHKLQIGRWQSVIHNTDGNKGQE